MVNAPLFHRPPATASSPHSAEPLPLDAEREHSRVTPAAYAAFTEATSERLTDAQRAQQRLSGTVWSHGPALGVYRGGLVLGRQLARWGVSADALTLASLVLAIGAAVAAAAGWFPLAAVLVLASGACDGLDGIVARTTGCTSRSGALLDSTVDRLSDGLPLVGLCVFYSGSGYVVAIPAMAMMGAFIVSYVRARASALGAELPPLFMRRPERVLWVATIFALGSVTLQSLAVLAPVVLFGTTVLAVLSFAGAFSALKHARVLLSDQTALRPKEPSE